MGFNSKFPRNVAYAPKWFGGLGFKHLYCEQGSLKIQRFSAHIQLQTTLGMFLLLNVDWLQQLAGISQHILEYTKHIEGTRNTWLNNMREFLDYIHGKILLNNPWTIPIIRQNDSHIMDHTLVPTISKKQQGIINHVRQYLQVTTFAKLIDNNGINFHKGTCGKTDAHN